MQVTGVGYDVTLDGFDPRRRVGFEYVSFAERGRDLDAGEAAALERAAEVRVLVVLAADSAAIEEQARAFLAELPTE